MSLRRGVPAVVAYLGAFAVMTSFAVQHSAQRSADRAAVPDGHAGGVPTVRLPPGSDPRPRPVAPTPGLEVAGRRATGRPITLPAVTTGADAPSSDERATAPTRRTERPTTTPTRRPQAAPERDRRPAVPPVTTTPAAPTPPSAAPPTVPVTATSASSATLRSVSSRPEGEDAQVLLLHFDVRRPDVEGVTDVTLPVTVPRSASPDALRIDVRFDLDAPGGPSATVAIADAEPASTSVTVDGSGKDGAEQAVVVPLPLQGDETPVAAPAAPFRTPPRTLDLPVVSAAPSADRPGRSDPSPR